MTLARRTLRHSATVDFRRTMSSRSYRPWTFEIRTATIGTSTNAQENAPPQATAAITVTKSAVAPSAQANTRRYVPLTAHRLPYRLEQLDVIVVLDRFGGQEAPVLNMLRRARRVPWRRLSVALFEEAELARFDLDCLQVRHAYLVPDLGLVDGQTAPHSLVRPPATTCSAAKPLLEGQAKRNCASIVSRGPHNWTHVGCISPIQWTFRARTKAIKFLWEDCPRIPIDGRSTYLCKGRPPK